MMITGMIDLTWRDTPPLLKKSFILGTYLADISPEYASHGQFFE